MPPETLLKSNPDLIAADMDGETVMMSIDRGAYFGIAGVGSRIWELLATPISIAQITQTICDEYEVDADTCMADVQKFARDLIQHQLVSTA